MATAARNIACTTFAVLVEDPVLRYELEPCIRRSEGRVVVDSSGIRTGVEGPCDIRTTQPDIVVVEQPRDDRALATLIDTIRADAPEAQVLVVARHADAETILAAIRGGARDFILSPLGHSFTDAVDRVLGDKPRSPPRAAGHAGGKVVGFLSAKGGCGATTLALGTAIALSRDTTAPTLLADFDLGAGVLRFLINSDNQYSVLDAALQTDKLDESYWGALVSNYCGIDVVGVHPRDFTRPETQSANFTGVLRFMRSRYAWSFLDLGRGISSSSAGLFDDIDALYIVATADPLALIRAKCVADFLRLRCGYHSSHLVLNGIEKLRPNAVAEAERRTQMEVCCTIPNADKEIRAALLARRPLAANALLSRSCRVLARKVAGLAPSPAPGAAKGLILGMRRIFAKLSRPALTGALSPPGEAQWELNTRAATTAARAGRLGQACEHLATALEAASVFGPEDPRVGQTFVQLGIAQGSQEKYAEAERSLERGAGILEGALGKTHPLTVKARSHLAAAFKARGKLAAAQQLYDTLLPEAEAALGSRHPVIADVLDGLGDVHLAVGDTPAALFALRSALAIKEEHLGSADWDVALTLEKLGEFYLKQGRYNEAEPLLWRVISIRTAILGEGSPGLADSYMKLGSLYASQRKFLDAQRLMRYSLALLSTGELAPDVPARLCKLAEVAEGLAKLSEAAAIRELASSIASVAPDARAALGREFRPSLSVVPRPAVCPAWARAEAYPAAIGLSGSR